MKLPLPRRRSADDAAATTQARVIPDPGQVPTARGTWV